MDQRINKSLIACIEHYKTETMSTPTDYVQPIVGVFESEVTFMEKVEAMDNLVDNHPDLEELREVFFDLLLLNFLAADASKLEEDYLESDEWISIEEQTIDRGTELLNLLLYLAECADEGIEADLEDFLKEFLLVEDDEFQDEYRIYEPIIAQQILTESSYEEIAKAATKLSPDLEITELFYPIMSFFYDQDPESADVEDFLEVAPRPAFDHAIYQLIIHYNN